MVPASLFSHRMPNNAYTIIQLMFQKKKYINFIFSSLEQECWQWVKKTEFHSLIYLFDELRSSNVEHITELISLLSDLLQLLSIPLSVWQNSHYIRTAVLRNHFIIGQQGFIQFVWCCFTYLKILARFSTRSPKRDECHFPWDKADFQENDQMTSVWDGSEPWAVYALVQLHF